MKVKATTNFAGEICMAKGDVRDVPESVAAPLLECGYLEALEPVQTSEQKDEQDSAYHTELFAYDGKYEVGLLNRDEVKLLLRTVKQPFAEKTS